MTNTISLIAAMADDRVIGINNSLPWKLPADMKWFRQHTLGKPIIMGRATFESFGGKPLPYRTNIIITRDESYAPAGTIVVHSIDEAIAAAMSAEHEGDETMVIGGASFYEQMLPYADRFYLTKVHGKFEGDAWFPEYEKYDWKEISREDRDADEDNPYACSFIILEK